MAFAASKPVTAVAAALELRAAAGRVGIAFGSTGCRCNSRCPDIGPRRPACDASEGDLLIRPQWVRLRAASPLPVRDQAERDQTRHASVMRRARSCGRFSRSREAKLFGPPW